MSSLVFIDTNILLDFYRVRGREKSLRILDRFDRHHERIITTSQVEMEYKKNRQKVIAEGLQGFKKPDTHQVPAFLRESQPQQRIEKSHKDISKQIQRLKERTSKLFRNPSQHDPVYKVLQRLFKANCSIHLNWDKEERHGIRRLARKRFILGYPPRKSGDNSIGDAVNWEWIVHCALQSTDDVVIVSRDSDYGYILGDEAFLNDWLRQEFKERVSKKRSAVLTTRLTEGFKLADIHVTKEEREDEERLVEELRSQAAMESRDDGEGESS